MMGYVRKNYVRKKCRDLHFSPKLYILKESCAIRLLKYNFGTGKDLSYYYKVNNKFFI